ncbi:putative EPIDERMAL PATTERNING FACTOR-like protein [Helianthus annuus]|uniref:Epidermal patterning factor-like protein n=1 Tax=Helianthus annuus TaxID=4232 RepID=A0A251V486_HELAN|nr:EPIDERMAL PATTERNING FACTOR-like protein 6 [Helianthus annuus]KAF5812492.1 putative EPIDERMAL PATTERNING FACTOR-like protein [Helianthus annuus]KAJ0941746.1 putative EPIDERMAL PATTERNING FACTOR-like protein [Helianthus annuus]
MDRRIWLLIIVWQIMMSWVCARNMHFAPSHDLQHQAQILHPPRTPIDMQKGAKEEEVVNRVGSRPPRCEHKCRGCAPCSPTQVPTVHFGLQYANYEPEGWKCKCGSVFYNP